MKRSYLCVLAMAASVAGLAGPLPALAAVTPLRLVATVGADTRPLESAERRKPSAELRAETLLAKGVRHLKTHGSSAADDFSDKPEFIDQDLYVFAVDTEGVMRGSGGWSVSLVGQNVLDELDAKGQPFFRQMIDQALTQGGGQVEYEWYNPANSESTRKTTNFVLVDDIVVGVGFYLERARPVEAKRLLRRAVDALRDDEDVLRVLEAFQEPAGPYVENDLYVFVVDTRNQKFLAHGGSTDLMGTDAYELVDVSGRHIVREMAETAVDSGAGELDYLWFNPMTGQTENKRTFFTLEGHLLVGVGSYEP